MDEKSKKINNKHSFEVSPEEISFNFFRSSGPGGQNVNKVSTGVRIHWNIGKSEFLTEEQKEKIIKRYPRKITKEGKIMIECEETRSQLRNKEIALEKLYKLLGKGLKEEKRRKKRKPSKSAVEARIKEKKEISEKKKRRRKPTLEKET